jgi:hypothetical protein
MNPSSAILRFVLSVNLLFLIILLFSFPFLTFGSASFVAATLALVPVLLSIAISSLLAYYEYNLFDPGFASEE